MKEIKIKIEGMYCVGCSNRLEKVLSNANGIKRAEVLLEQKQAIVVFDENETNINNIKEVIEEAGFKGE